LCGEKLTESFVTQAIAGVCTAAEWTPRFALLAPERDAAGRWRYTLFYEGMAGPDFAARLDEKLRENPHYALCRDLGQLGDPGRCEIAHAAYETFCAAQVSEGRRLGEIKPQALSSRNDWRSRFVEKPSAEPNAAPRS